MDIQTHLKYVKAWPIHIQMLFDPGNAKVLCNQYANICMWK